MMNAEELTENIVDSTESIEGFKKIVPNLLKELFSGPKSNLRTFINVITSIVTSDDESPANKFYGLYLLLKACESNPSELFIDEFASKEDLMSSIFQAAQFDVKKGSSPEKGKTFFSESPSKEDACIGINYVRLAIEVLVYCGTHFGTQDMTESNYNFWFKMESLSKRMQLPSTYWFIEKNYYEDDEVASWDFNSKPLPFISTQAPGKTKPTPTPSANIANIATTATPITTSTISQKPTTVQPTTPTTTQKASAFEKLNDPKILIKSRNDLSNTSQNISTSILDDKSMEKKTLGMRMAEMGMFTDDKKTRSRSPTPTAASRRDKTPEGSKTQDIRNFFNERERATQQVKATSVKNWQTSETNLDMKAPIEQLPGNNMSIAKSNQSIPGHSHQSSRQMSDAPQDPFSSRGIPETRGRGPHTSYAVNERMQNEERAVKSSAIANPIYGKEKKEVSPYRGEQAGAGWLGFERVNPKFETPGKPTTPRSVAQPQVQQGFDFNKGDNRTMGTGDDGVYKEKYRVAAAENENMKRENEHLKNEIERFKKELYAKNMNEENLIKENRALKAEISQSQGPRGDRSEALAKENNHLRSRFAEYESRIGDLTNSLTALSYENKQLKQSLEEKERELEESQDMPVRHIVYPGANPFIPAPQTQERRDDPPILGGGYQSKGPYTLGGYNTPDRYNQYPEGMGNMYSGDMGRRPADEGMFFSSGTEQQGGGAKKNLFEKVKYDKPGMVLSKDYSYH